MVDPSPLKLATRGSPLALAQANMIAAMVGQPVELVTFSTRGDRTPGPLDRIGGKGLFTAELEAALRTRQVHFAVHSAKDMPAAMADDLVIAAVPPREDARDGLISLAGLSVAQLPPRGRVGTSSLRRSLQLKAVRPDLQFLPLRGNVDTRLRKLREGQYDAIILAMAGMKRLGVFEQVRAMVQPMEVDGFVPAAGQGALALQCLTDDAATRAVLQRLSDPASAAALAAERQVVHALGAGCQSALGVHIRPMAGEWCGDGMVADPSDGRIIRLVVTGPTAPAVAQALTERLIERGARELLTKAEPSEREAEAG